MNTTLMKIPLEEVDHIAKLAQLSLTEDQRLMFAKQLNDILSYMEKLENVDTAGTAPTFHALNIINAFREDTVERSLAKEEALENAPQKDTDFFLVPWVI